MEKEKISVIIPVYKVEKYLDRCVESVVNQTYRNLEIILVDDGSPDNCPQMCDEWAQKDERIKVIHKQNGGLSDARNFGIDASTGKYLTFVDSDDLISKNAVQRLYELKKQNNADISMCSFKNFSNENELVKSKHETPKITILKGKSVLNQIYNPSWKLGVIAWGKLYNKSLFDKVKFPVGRLHEDEFIFAQILENCKCFVYTSEQLYYYFYNTTSITKTLKEKNITDAHDAFLNRYKFLNEKFPENKQKNDIHYLTNLRALCIMSLKFTDLNKELIDEFNAFYKSIKKHGFKNFIFYHFRKLYIKLYKIKNHG